MNTRTGTSTGRRIDPNLIFQYVAAMYDDTVRDNVSGTDASQTYAGTNRNRTNSAGNLEAVAANTPVIDHIGSSLTPALRVEPQIANILLGTPPTTQDLTLGIGSFTLQVSGAGTAVSSAGTATITGAGTASDGTPNTFAVTAAGTVHITITTATVVWLIPGSIPSSYFAGAAAIGAELVTDGAFSVVTDDAGELSSGTFTVGNCYKISAHDDADFTTVGAPDSNVGTYFNATATGAGLLDAGDKVFPVTFDNWTAGTGWAPQATAGSLTGKAQHIGGTAGVITSTGSSVASGKVLRLQVTATVSAGALYPYYSAATQAAFPIAVADTYTFYTTTTASGDVGFSSNSTFAGTIDDVSVMEHGTVRLSEANTVTIAIPAAVAAAIADTGTVVVDWMPSYNRAAGVVTGIVSFDGNTASGLYTTTAAGNLSSFDGTAVAESTAAYTKNVWHRLVSKWPSDTDKYKVGASIAMAGVAYGSEAAFDGDYSAGANLVIGTALHGPMWIKSIRIYDKVLTDAQINAM